MSVHARILGVLAYSQFYNMCTCINNFVRTKKAKMKLMHESGKLHIIVILNSYESCNVGTIIYKVSITNILNGFHKFDVDSTLMMAFWALWS